MGCLQQFPLSNELALQREPDVLLVGTDVDMQTSQEMRPENGTFLHTGKAMPPFIATESGEQLPAPSYKYMSGRALEGLFLGAQLKLPPAMLVSAGHSLNLKVVRD